MSNKILISDVIDRLNALECEKEPLTSYKIEQAEKKLEVQFPVDFVKLNSICSYEYMSYFSTFCFEEGVVDTTLEWRESVNSPKNCVALSEEGESAVIMRITGDNAEVIWCDIPDLYNLCEGKPFEYNPTIFPTFTDFYSFLIEEEEKIRAEEAEGKSG